MRSLSSLSTHREILADSTSRTLPPCTSWYGEHLTEIETSGMESQTCLYYVSSSEECWWHCARIAIRLNHNVHFTLRYQCWRHTFCKKDGMLPPVENDHVRGFKQENAGTWRFPTHTATYKYLFFPMLIPEDFWHTYCVIQVLLYSNSILMWTLDFMYLHSSEIPV